MPCCTETSSQRETVQSVVLQAKQLVSCRNCLAEEDRGAQPQPECRAINAAELCGTFCAGVRGRNRQRVCDASAEGFSSCSRNRRRNSGNRRQCLADGPHALQCRELPRCSWRRHRLRWRLRSASGSALARRTRWPSSGCWPALLRIRKLLAVASRSCTNTAGALWGYHRRSGELRTGRCRVDLTRRSLDDRTAVASMRLSGALLLAASQSGYLHAQSAAAQLGCLLASGARRCWTAQPLACAGHAGTSAGFSFSLSRVWPKAAGCAGVPLWHCLQYGIDFAGRGLGQQAHVIERPQPMGFFSPNILTSVVSPA
jgi:hypothetical protein